jgi:HEPN domain-containing protein
MEDVLDLYAETDDPQRPWVCFDEKPYQRISHTREPLPMEPGKPLRIDYEYRREGTCNLFQVFDPHRAWRHIEVTERRTAVDFAQQMKWLVDKVYPKAEIIRVMLDPLNTHSLDSLYETFAPEEARRIARRLEFHYTPKHASWLNMAEIEFSVLERQCLERRLGSSKEVRRETSAWAEARNRAGATVQWRFNLEKARTKMHWFYPSQLP